MAAAYKEILTGCLPATEEDWRTEYLDLILAVMVVRISGVRSTIFILIVPSEAIITSSYQKACSFVQRVDAAAVFVNASTRFTDGHQFGFGAEIGISTQKLHARGPMGLQELTTTKFVILGSGQVRS